MQFFVFLVLASLFLAPAGVAAGKQETTYIFDSGENSTGFVQFKHPGGVVPYPDGIGSNKYPPYRHEHLPANQVESLIDGRSHSNEKFDSALWKEHGDRCAMLPDLLHRSLVGLTSAHLHELLGNAYSDRDHFQDYVLNQPANSKASQLLLEFDVNGNDTVCRYRLAEKPGGWMRQKSDTAIKRVSSWRKGEDANTPSPSL